jgi:hypothetical protein
MGFPQFLGFLKDVSWEDESAISGECKAIKRVSVVN